MINVDPAASFFVRMCQALGKTPKQLAEELRVPFGEIKPLLKGTTATVGDVDRHELWWKIKRHVAEQIGALMAINAELDKALQSTRAARAARHAKQLRYFNEN